MLQDLVYLQVSGCVDVDNLEQRAFLFHCLRSEYLVQEVSWSLCGLTECEDAQRLVLFMAADNLFDDLGEISCQLGLPLREHLQTLRHTVDHYYLPFALILFLVYCVRHHHLHILLLDRIFCFAKWTKLHSASSLSLPIAVRRLWLRSSVDAQEV